MVLDENEYVCIYVCMYVCVCICVHMGIWVYVPVFCIYVCGEMVDFSESNNLCVCV